VGIYRSLRKRMDRRFRAWIDARFQVLEQQTLNRGNLFILPTRRGMIFSLIIFAVWVLGTNYQNNLILAAAFFMSSIFVVAILQTFANVNKIQLHLNSNSECFAGDSLDVHFRLENLKRSWSESIEIAWEDNENISIIESLEPGEKKIDVKVPLVTQERGIIKTQRMLIQTYFPFGIIRCWTWQKWDVQALVYPRPKHSDLREASVSDDEGDGHNPVRGGDDFSGLKTYQNGDPLGRVAWKTYAAGQGLHSKEFSQNISKELWLDFDSLGSKGIEEKLSILCYWVQQYYFDDENYGLNLPTLQILPGRGDLHRRKCLRALTLYGYAS
jgi:uncharacterized protein (DUF58 family)